MGRRRKQRTVSASALSQMGVCERLVVLDDANASALGVTFDLLVTAFVHAVIAARAIDQFGCPR